MNKVIDSVWLSGIPLIGIVVMENGIGDRKAYIGTALGNDISEDEQRIMETGFPIYESHLTRVLKSLRRE